jgi:hypothetical protein
MQGAAVTPPHYPSSADVARIVRVCLDEGKIVEIDGLGTFRPRKDGSFEFIADTQPRVFIAYADEEYASARRLYDGLAAAGFSPWMDKLKLLPGQNWPRAIERAIGISDFFVACFSRRAARKRGQFQCELRYALDCAARLPLDDVFLIPIRLDDCAVPRRISDHFQYVDMFPDWEQGVTRIAKVIAEQARERHDRPLLLAS